MKMLLILKSLCILLLYAITTCEGALTDDIRGAVNMFKTHVQGNRRNGAYTQMPNSPIAGQNPPGLPYYEPHTQQIPPGQPQNPPTHQYPPTNPQPNPQQYPPAQPQQYPPAQPQPLPPPPKNSIASVVKAGIKAAIPVVPSMRRAAPVLVPVIITDTRYHGDPGTCTNPITITEADRDFATGAIRRDNINEAQHTRNGIIARLTGDDTSLQVFNQHANQGFTNVPLISPCLKKRNRKKSKVARRVWKYEKKNLRKYCSGIKSKEEKTFPNDAKSLVIELGRIESHLRSIFSDFATAIETRTFGRDPFLVQLNRIFHDASELGQFTVHVRRLINNRELSEDCLSLLQRAETTCKVLELNGFEMSEMARGGLTTHFGTFLFSALPFMDKVVYLASAKHFLKSLFDPAHVAPADD